MFQIQFEDVALNPFASMERVDAAEWNASKKYLANGAVLTGRINSLHRCWAIGLYDDAKSAVQSASAIVIDVSRRVAARSLTIALGCEADMTRPAAGSTRCSVKKTFRQGAGGFAANA
jgi:hypothetical protein